MYALVVTSVCVAVVLSAVTWWAVPHRMQTADPVWRPQKVDRWLARNERHLPQTDRDRVRDGVLCGDTLPEGELRRAAFRLASALMNRKLRLWSARTVAVGALNMSLAIVYICITLTVGQRHVWPFTILGVFWLCGAVVAIWTSRGRLRPIWQARAGNAPESEYRDPRLGLSVASIFAQVNNQPAHPSQRKMNNTWTDEYEGLRRALNVRKTIERTGQLAPSFTPSPLPLPPGEIHFGFSPARVYKFDLVQGSPGDRRYITWQFKRRTVVGDPLGMLILLPLRLGFNAFSYLVASFIYSMRKDRAERQWREVVRGQLVLTAHAILIQGANGARWMMPWPLISEAKLMDSGTGIRIIYKRQTFSIELPAESRLWIYVAIRFLALGDISFEPGVPADFYDRARLAGRRIEEI